MPNKSRTADQTVASKPADATTLTQASPSSVSLDQVEKDPDFENLLDPGDDKDLEKLYEEVRRDGGFRDRVVAWKIGEGKYLLIDGYRRYRVWVKYFKSDPAFAPMVIVIEFPDRRAAELWIFRNQLCRRNLSDAQRIDVARKFEPIFAARAKANRDRGVRLNSDEGQKSVDTNAMVAEIAQVSRDTYCKGKKVLEHGTPELVESVKKGRISINAAVHAVASPPEEQNEIARAAQSSKSWPKKTKTPQPAKATAEIEVPSEDVSSNQVQPCELTDIVNAIGRYALALRRDFEQGGTGHVDIPAKVAELRSAEDSLKQILEVIDPQLSSSAGPETVTLQPTNPITDKSRADADAEKRLIEMTCLINGILKDLDLMMHAIHAAAPTNHRSLEYLFERLYGEVTKSLQSSITMVNLWKSGSQLTVPTDHNASIAARAS